ncbi:hypothetical protein BDV36DRAFT_190481 [Aspergillus pseudocaelatus]|uniref:Uncharacterized protein n=1 Tax=Aspergillus pseudocaelatus TaxID=1825620 RepID=A0ABQ6WLC9_9EURO|nr:hypothetical protein BDV36DRAFT_190481 [Aspergillus pseudocaelatus]
MDIDGKIFGIPRSKETLDRSFSYLLFPHGLDNGKPPNGLLAVVVHALGCTIKSLSPGIRQPGITLAASTAISIWVGTLFLGSNNSNIHSASRRSGHMYVWKRVKLQISIPPDLLSLFFPFFTDCCPLGCHVPRSIIFSPTARGQVILATDDSIS